MANLFTSQTPASGDNSDGTPGITTATSVRFAEDGTVTGVRFYATATVGGTYTVGLWEVTAADPNGSGGTLLASKTMGVTPDAGTWNSVAFDDAVAVVTTELYRVGVFSGDGRYVFTSTFFGSDLVNGNITADANGDDPVGLGNLNQGSFTINAAFSYPTSQPGSSCYFVDVEYTAGEATPISVGDAGASAEALTVTAAVPAADAGSAADTMVVAAAVPAADGGAAAESLTAAVTSPLADGGSAVDSIEVFADSRNVDLTDGGTCVDTAVTDGVELSTRRGGWETYGDALRFNAEQARYEQTRVPVDCPNDLEPLIAGPDGSLRCPFDGWSWPERRILDRP